MQLQIKKMLTNLWAIEPHERLKTLYLGVAFFFIIFCYTIIKELKDSVFMEILGNKNYVPYAKLLTIIGFVPLVFLYSKLIDNMRRYQVLVAFSCVYALIGLFSAYLIGHASVGLDNDVTGPHRIFGWMFYFFVESFSPFVLSVFWAFINSVTDPKGAKENYGLLIAFSKLGGMCSAGFGWWFLHNHITLKLWGLTDTSMIQILMIIASLALLMVPVTIIMMMKAVPGKYLHGYEAAYQFEKEQSKKGKERTGILSGLSMLLKQPYAFGIFGIVLFYEIINSVLSFQRLGVAQSVGCTIAGTSCFLLGLSFSVHCVGFFISFLGTRTLVSKLGERLSLLLLPVVTGTLLFYFIFSHSPRSLLICFVVIRAIYYAFNQPVTEALYIPAVKELKFKSKSWIDTFGKKMAKGAGSLANMVSAQFGPGLFQIIHTGFFGIVLVLWMVVAYFLGKRYDKAIKNQEVIGAED